MIEVSDFVAEERTAVVLYVQMLQISNPSLLKKVDAAVLLKNLLLEGREMLNACAEMIVMLEIVGPLFSSNVILEIRLLLLLIGKVKLL